MPCLCCNGSFSDFLTGLGMGWFLVCWLVFPSGIGWKLQKSWRETGDGQANSTSEMQQLSGLPSPGLEIPRHGLEVAQTHAIFLQNGQSSKSERDGFHTAAMLDHCRGKS